MPVSYFTLTETHWNHVPLHARKQLPPRFDAGINSDDHSARRDYLSTRDELLVRTDQATLRKMAGNERTLNAGELCLAGGHQCR